MKKLVYLIVLMLILGLIVTGCSLLGVTPVEKGNSNGHGNGIDLTGYHFNLNLVGKKANWNGGGGYDNPDRHTIFVPEDTSGYFTPNGKPGITIWMTQSDDDDFAVIDGNALDGVAKFQLASGTYDVFIVAKAKPAKPGEDRYTDITGWVYAVDEFGGAYYLNIGSIKVTKSKKWQDANDLFYVTPGEDTFNIITEDTWVFTYMTALETWDFGTDPSIDDTAYFWQYDNNGNKLVKVRFYKR